MPPKAGQPEITADARFNNQPSGLSILGHQRDPRRDRIAITRELESFSIDRNRARDRRCKPKDRLQQFSPASANQPTDANNLTTANLKVYFVLWPSRSSHAIQLKHGFTKVVGFPGVKLINVPPHHQLDHRVVGDLVSLQRACIFSVAKNRYAVGQFFDFSQPMRNVDDTDALLFQIANHFKKGVRFALGKTAGRLVHDQNTGVYRKCFGNLNQLLQTDRQLADFNIGFDLQANLGKILSRSLTNCL